MDKIWYDSRGILYTDQGILLCPYCPCVDESSSSSSGSSSSGSSSSSSSSGWPPYECETLPCDLRSWTDDCTGPTPPNSCITTYNTYTGGRLRATGSGTPRYVGVVDAYEAEQVIGGATYRGYFDEFINAGTLQLEIVDNDPGTSSFYAQLAPASTFYSMAITENGSTFYSHTASHIPNLGDIMELQCDIVRISDTQCEYTFTARVIRGGSPLFEYTWSQVFTKGLPCHSYLRLFGPTVGWAEFDDIYLGST